MFGMKHHLKNRELQISYLSCLRPLSDIVCHAAKKTEAPSTQIPKRARDTKEWIQTVDELHVNKHVWHWIEHWADQLMVSIWNDLWSMFKVQMRHLHIFVNPWKDLAFLNYSRLQLAFWSNSATRPEPHCIQNPETYYHHARDSCPPEHAWYL